MAERLNIPFITSDQQRGDCYGFEGRRVKTRTWTTLGKRAWASIRRFRPRGSHHHRH